MTRLPNPDDLYYEAHVFCCTNEREADHPRGSCTARGGAPLRDYMKTRAKEKGLKGKVRINSSGCLDRCELGPCVVIYPEGIWYSYRTEADVDEILDRHIIGGEVVDRLMLDKNQREPRDTVPVEGDRLALRVADIATLTPAIKQFTLMAADGGLLPVFDAGAHINIETGVVDGKTPSRSYSLCNDPADRWRYVIAVQKELGGDGGSIWMHDKLSVGNQLSISAPANNFSLAEKGERHLLIAGGIGITPILSMMRVLARTGADFEMHYCARVAEGTAFQGEIKQDFSEQATFHFDGGDPARGIVLAPVIGIYAPGRHLYVCGPSGLMDAVIGTARDAGWPDDAVHFEYFNADPVSHANDEPFEIMLSDSGRLLTVPADKSILEVLRENDIKWDSSCESGTCGTCTAKLLGGAADHRDMVLNDTEKSKNNEIMICVSRAKKGEILVLDL